MTKPKNEAERLLNTIVSSRARLAAMRGDSVGSVEPSMETEQAQSSDGVPGEMLPPPAVDSVSFDELPVEDEHTDISEPALILGIEESPAQDDSDDLWASFANAEMTGPESPDTDSDATMPPSDILPESNDGVTEVDSDDPFSFIDLIPPPAEDPPQMETEKDEPLDTPPPVRDRPLMPLPVTLANWAPQRSEPSPETALSAPSPDVPAPESSPEPPVLPPMPETAPTEPTWPESAKPESESAPVVIEDLTSAAGLSQPRQVAPRVVDPNRDRLEVDVIVDELDDDEPLTFEAEVPQLTTASTAEPAPPPPEPQTDAASLFDAVSAGFDCLRQGNMHAAMMHFSDALDWEPEQIEARLARGRCRRDLGDAAGAMSDFLLSQDHAPHSPEPHVEMGDLFFSRKDYSRAIAHYDDALELQPEHAMALCRRGISHHHTRRPGQALEDLREAARVDPSIPNITRYVRMVSHRR